MGTGRARDREGSEGGGAASRSTPPSWQAGGRCSLSCSSVERGAKALVFGRRAPAESEARGRRSPADPRSPVRIAVAARRPGRPPGGSAHDPALGQVGGGPDRGDLRRGHRGQRHPRAVRHAVARRHAQSRDPRLDPRHEELSGHRRGDDVVRAGADAHRPVALAPGEARSQHRPHQAATGDRWQLATGGQPPGRVRHVPVADVGSRRGAHRARLQGAGAAGSHGRRPACAVIRP